MKIYLDAGHGGRARGAEYGDVAEADLNLRIVKQIFRALPENIQCDFQLSRTQDVYIQNSKRGEAARDHRAELAILVHCNAFPHSWAHGGMVLHRPGSTFARTVGDVIARSLPYPLWKASNTQSFKAEPGLFPSALHLLSNFKMPTILVECGYMSNDGDLSALQEPLVIDGIALAVYNGIIRAHQAKKER